jgi:hypothetical protein
MHKSATKCNETIGKWCKNKHGASKIIDTLETYHTFTCFYSAAERRVHPQPKRLGTGSFSSHVSSPLQIEIDHDDHAIKLSSTVCTPSSSSLPRKATGASPEPTPEPHVTGDSPEN